MPKRIGFWLKGQHYDSQSPEYKSWKLAKDNCYKPTAFRYADYGGRGTTMCARWRDSFRAFVEDMGQRPEDTVLCRRDHSGNFTPENCLWRTRSEDKQYRDSIKRAKKEAAA